MLNANLEQNHENGKNPSYNLEPSAQEVFEQVMANQLPVFAEIQQIAFEMMWDDIRKKPRTYQNRNSKANRMNENIKGLLFERFPNEMKEDSDQRFWFLKEGSCIIYFKKLDDNLMPMNVATGRSRRILEQHSLFTKLPEIFVGYRPNRSWEEIVNLCAVYISKGKRIWVTDLRDFESGISQLPIFPQTPIVDVPLLVKPKAKKSVDDQQISSS